MRAENVFTQTEHSIGLGYNREESSENRFPFYKENNFGCVVLIPISGSISNCSFSVAFLLASATILIDILFTCRSFIQLSELCE